MRSHKFDYGISGGRNHYFEKWDRDTKEQRSVYKSPEWVKARTNWIKNEPTCRICGDRGHTVDHIKPHRGDMTLFWDTTNWQTLCFKCHQKKRGEERHDK